MEKEKKSIKISVIVPIYGVEKYLAECVESVLSQSYQNIELILVNDGSPDRSLDICEQYAETCSKVKVIDKKNGGLSDARNKGVEQATGDYIAFLDGDDFWDDSEALENLVRRLEVTKADVLNFSFKKYYEDTEEKILYFQNVAAMPTELKNKKEQLQYLSDKQLYISSACTKLIKTSLMLKENLLFEKGVYSEDVEWSARLLKCADSMDFICANFYCYRQRRDSISHTINDKKCGDLCKHILNCIEMYEKANGEEKEALGVYSAYQFGTYFLVQAQAEHPQKECISKLKNYTKILNYHKGNKKLQLLNLGCKIVRYTTMCKMIRIAYRVKNK